MDIKEMLEKQIAMLSEQSESATTGDLCDLTHAMCRVVALLRGIKEREAAAAFDAAMLKHCRESRSYEKDKSLHYYGGIWRKEGVKREGRNAIPFHAWKPSRRTGGKPYSESHRTMR